MLCIVVACAITLKEPVLRRLQHHLPKEDSVHDCGCNEPPPGRSDLTKTGASMARGFRTSIENSIWFTDICGCPWSWKWGARGNRTGTDAHDKEWLFPC